MKTNKRPAIVPIDIPTPNTRPLQDDTVCVFTMVVEYAEALDTSNIQELIEKARESGGVHTARYTILKRTNVDLI